MNLVEDAKVTSDPFFRQFCCLLISALRDGYGVRRIVIVDT